MIPKVSITHLSPFPKGCMLCILQGHLQLLNATVDHAEGIKEADERRRVESKQAGTSGQALVGKYVPPAARNQGTASDTMGGSGMSICGCCILHGLLTDGFSVYGRLLVSS